MPVSTGSDTRMYSPRSESNLGYANDAEDNPHGVGDPETMEQLRDKRMAEAESKQTWEVLNQNRSLKDRMDAGRSLLSFPIEDLMPDLYEWEVNQE